MGNTSDNNKENKTAGQRKRRLNVGILAHVDAGKTTLSEGMLYLSGSIRDMGRVDHGDAFLDTYEMERERGITIFVTTHYMDEAEYCDRISMMVDGKIKAIDTPERLKQQYQAQNMDEVFQQLARGAIRKSD